MRINLADRALIVGKCRVLDNGGHGTIVAPHDASIARGILDFG